MESKTAGRIIGQIALIMMIAIGTIEQVKGLTFEISPKSTECYFEQINEGEKVQLFYQVLRGGLLDIQLQISQSGIMIYDVLHFSGEMDGRYEFVAGTTAFYRFCFNNEMSRFTPKVVSFQLVIGSDRWGSDQIDPLKPSSTAVRPKDLDPMEASARQISMSLDVLQRHQKYLRSRFRRHRDTSDSINSRVVWISIIESLTLIFVHLIQIYTIRSFFKRPARG